MARFCPLFYPILTFIYFWGDFGYNLVIIFLHRAAKCEFFQQKKWNDNFKNTAAYSTAIDRPYRQI